ncbi:unnamed protein product [Peniophora sp. CBMAI 1063]|nr:unnamed protein product [Peniophora sp. CBMAI 1063]
MWPSTCSSFGLHKVGLDHDRFTELLSFPEAPENSVPGHRPFRCCVLLVCGTVYIGSSSPDGRRMKISQWTSSSTPDYWRFFGPITSPSHSFCRGKVDKAQAHPCSCTTVFVQ